MEDVRADVNALLKSKNPDTNDGAAVVEKMLSQAEDAQKSLDELIATAKSYLKK